MGVGTWVQVPLEATGISFLGAGVTSWEVSTEEQLVFLTLELSLLSTTLIFHSAQSSVLDRTHLFALLKQLICFVGRSCHLLALQLTKFAVWVPQSGDDASGARRSSPSSRGLSHLSVRLLHSEVTYYQMEMPQSDCWQEVRMPHLSNTSMPYISKVQENQAD